MVLAFTAKRKSCLLDGGRNMGQRRVICGPLDLEAKAKQASKLAEIREALIRAGCDTTAKQAVVLGVCRATAWALLNRDKRAGPSSVVIKRFFHRQASRQQRGEKSKNIFSRRSLACMGTQMSGDGGFAIR